MATPTARPTDSAQRLLYVAASAAHAGAAPAPKPTDSEQRLLFSLAKSLIP